MRVAFPLLVLVTAALAACTPSTPPPADPSPAPAADPSAAPASAPAPAPAPATAPAPAVLDAQALAAAHWQLVDAVDAGGNRIDALFPDSGRSLQLDFADGRISVSGGCNRMVGGYTLSGERFEVGALAQTKRMCASALMAADAAIGARLAGAGSLAASPGGGLVLTTAGGDRLDFTGEPTAATRFGGQGERLFLEVAPQRVPCQHPLMKNAQCLQVRDIVYDEQGLKQQPPGEWRPLYQDIEGYTHQPGIRNVLRIDRFELANPPADASSVVYVLDMVVESEAVQP